MFQTNPAQPDLAEQVLAESGSLAQPQASTFLLDDPHEWSSFGRPTGQNSQAPIPEEPTDSPVWDSFVVLEGMHCAACALTIEEALKAVPGVEGAEVSAATRRARVVWRHAQVLPSQWMEAVSRAGYRALPARDAFARELRQAESRRALWRWLVAGFCMMQVMMYAWPSYTAKPGDLELEYETLLRWASWVISLPVVLFCCGPFFKSALKDISQRRVSMDLPVAIGMLITFIISTLGTFDPAGPFGREVFFDSLTMFVFFLLTGRWLELRLRDRTAGALEAVMNRLPDSVLRKLPDSDEFDRVATRRLRVGDVVRVLAGEAFPADGEILRGTTHADEALLTGESTAVLRSTGDAVTAGSYNLDSVVDVRVDSVGEGTRFAQIVNLMESASLQKPRLAQVADKVARPFLVVVLLAALAAAVWWWPVDPGKAMMVAVAMLIVTCPCALSLATPVAMLTAAGTLARGGVLVRNLQGLEALASVDTLVFDKTGTLTRDGLVLRHLTPATGQNKDESLALAALLASQSMHPASKALVRAFDAAQLPASEWALDAAQEVAGSGLDVWVQSKAGEQELGVRRHLRLGSAQHCNCTELAREEPGQSVMLAEEIDGAWLPLAQFHLSEDLRAEARAVIDALKQQGVSVQLLSGDRSAAVQAVAAKLGIEQARGDCKPQDKLAAMQAAQAAGHKVAMVGDGLNDGPVLAGAHVSFAFGRAVPLAQSRADFVVLGDSLDLVLQSLLLARRTLSVVRQNLGWAAAYNAVSIPLALMGWMPAWLAGLGMALSSLLVVANAARLARALPVAPAASDQSELAVTNLFVAPEPRAQGGH